MNCQQTAPLASAGPHCSSFTNPPPVSRFGLQPFPLDFQFLFVVCLLKSFVALALDPSLPPGGNFDLSKWKLTLPDPKTTEVAGVDLGKGFVDPLYFFTGPDGGMTFWCPVT